MKDFNDIDFKNRLKDGSPQPRYDEWFTQRVMKRLPEKKTNFRWLQYSIYLLCAIICGFFWKEFVGEFNFSAITVGEILKYVTLLGVSFTLLWQTLKTTLLSD